MGCSSFFFDREFFGEREEGKKKSEELEKSEYSEDFLNSEQCGARESEAIDLKIVRHKYVRMTETDDENENNFGYLKFISNFADADRIPQRPGRGLT